MSGPLPEGVELYRFKDRDEWLALRSGFLVINASEVAAICGCDPYSSALRVYYEKAGLIPPQPENELMRRGRYFEAAAFEWLKDERPGWDIRRAEVYLRSKPWRMGCTPDFIAVDPERPGFGVVQNKTINARTFREKWRGGAEDEEDAPITVPLGYQLQTLQELKLTGASWAAVSVLVVGDYKASLHVIDLEPSESAWSRMRAEVDFFCRCVAEGRPPPLDPEKDGETLSLLYPEPRKLETVDRSANNELPILALEREGLKKEISEREERIDQIDAQLKEAVGEYEAAILADGRVIKWKCEPRKGRIVEPSNPRVLRVGKLPKEKSK